MLHMGFEPDETRLSKTKYMCRRKHAHIKRIKESKRESDRERERQRERATEREGVRLA